MLNGLSIQEPFITWFIINNIFLILKYFYLIRMKSILVIIPLFFIYQCDEVEIYMVFAKIIDKF